MGGTRRRSHSKRAPPTCRLACAFDHANALVVPRKEGSFMSHVTKFFCLRSRRHQCLPWPCASCPPALPSRAHHIQAPPAISRLFPPPRETIPGTAGCLVAGRGWSLSPPLRIPPQLGRPPSKPYTGSRRHLVCVTTPCVCVI
jgi:hypothetical protein